MLQKRQNTFSNSFVFKNQIETQSEEGNVMLEQTLRLWSPNINSWLVTNVQL